MLTRNTWVGTVSWKILEFRGNCKYRVNICWRIESDSSFCFLCFRSASSPPSFSLPIFPWLSLSLTPSWPLSDYLFPSDYIFFARRKNTKKYSKLSVAIEYSRNWPKCLCFCTSWANANWFYTENLKIVALFKMRSWKLHTDVSSTWYENEHKWNVDLSFRADVQHISQLLPLQ